MNIHQGRFRKYLAEQQLLNIWPRTDKTETEHRRGRDEGTRPGAPATGEPAPASAAAVGAQNFKLAVGPDSEKQSVIVAVHRGDRS